MAIRFKKQPVQIEFESEDFPANRSLSGSGTLDVNWGDLIWAALTIGRPNLRTVLMHGKSSFYEAIFRISLIRMALEETGTYRRRLCRTPAFNALDPSEKGSVNYFIGMAICKLFASKKLHTPWLLHIDVYRNQLPPHVFSGRSRPDLTGQQNGTNSWHVFESKGRASTPDSDTKEKAKEQAWAMTFSGVPSSLHIGAITYYRNDELTFFWRDPESGEEEAIPVEVPEEAWQYYFEPFMALIEGNLDAGTPDERGMVMFPIEELDMKVGVHPEIFPLLVHGAWDVARATASEISSQFIKIGCQPDGLEVIAGEGWSQRRPKQ